MKGKEVVKKETALSQLLTAKEVAKQLRITTRTIYRRLEQGVFPQPIRLGPQCVRWDEADIKAWIDRNRVSSAAA
ncbi:helix-turn-helix transcriptional regulator [Komagataeibacter xylinus]|uniref:helix-turn-helix transcriptional regulator n=1 Tax=Komagataeibacter xylinus TaxID=28448 RepID=UPI000FDF96C3|nr:AlpA family phage regulatory protein [Komagataeibacter xylinus]AZV39954.1 hypothetical protein CXP35_15440 [Komagataeibacter xylinus]